MHKFDFDAELRGADGAALPVYCDVQLPYVGGQKAQIRLAVPARHISKKPPSNPCTLSGKSGAFTINMQGVNWRRFPCSAKSKFGLEAIELLHIERLTVLCPPINARRDIRFHLAPISYLRSEASFVHFGDRAGSNELFVLDLPGLGSTSFVAEWVTNYHRDAEIPGATVIAGFSAVANLPPGSPVDSAQVVAQFKTSARVKVVAASFMQRVA